jgi:hypothetical protein
MDSDQGVPVMDSGYQYFSIEELQCHGMDCCGGQAGMDHDFMVKLVSMRRELGFPFIVTSAYRCPLHNTRVSSTGDKGPHTTGHAADIAVKGYNAYRLLECALRHNMTGIGIKQTGKHRFIHLDDLNDHNRPVVWSY